MSEELTFTAAAAAAPETDEDLVRLVARGHTPAFEQLYTLYASAIYNYLLRLIGEPTAAEEVLQDVFMVLWRNAHSFRAEAKVKTWLLRIAHHQAVSWLRRQRPTAWPHEEWPADDDPLDEHMAQRWQIAQVRAAVSALSPKHRAVIELTFAHGLSYAEIAQVMGCPVGTVKSRMSYALRALAERLTAGAARD
jgi:RNA polymerase sigma-70 factor (ECF subfamily)